jgi:hypothetical protein
MKNYQKGSSILIVLIIILIIVAGAGAYYFTQNRPNIIKDQSFAGAELCNPGKIEKQPVNFKDTCYLQIATEANNPAICEKIQGAHNRDICYYRLAVSLKDLNLCSKSSTQDEVNGCYKGYAIKYKQPLLCAQIQTGSDKTTVMYRRYECYIQAAQQVSDCTPIEDGVIKNQCIDRVQKGFNQT